MPHTREHTREEKTKQKHVSGNKINKKLKNTCTNEKFVISLQRFLKTTHDWHIKKLHKQLKLLALLSSQTCSDSSKEN